MVSYDGYGSAQEFLDRFTKLAPSTMARPHFPSEHASDDVKKALKGKPAEEAAAPGTTPEKLTFSFYLPHGPINSSEKVRLMQAAGLRFLPAPSLPCAIRPRRQGLSARQMPFSSTEDTYLQLLFAAWADQLLFKGGHYATFSVEAFLSTLPTLLFWAVRPWRRVLFACKKFSSSVPGEAHLQLLPAARANQLLFKGRPHASCRVESPFDCLWYLRHPVTLGHMALQTRVVCLQEVLCFSFYLPHRPVDSSSKVSLMQVAAVMCVCSFCVRAVSVSHRSNCANHSTCCLEFSTAARRQSSVRYGLGLGVGFQGDP